MTVTKIKSFRLKSDPRVAGVPPIEIAKRMRARTWIHQVIKPLYVQDFFISLVCWSVLQYTQTIGWIHPLWRKCFRIISLTTPALVQCEVRLICPSRWDHLETIFSQLLFFFKAEQALQKHLLTYTIIGAQTGTRRCSQQHSTRSQSGRLTIQKQFVRPWADGMVPAVEHCCSTELPKATR